MANGFRAASRRRLKLRAAFSGASKSGKTFKSLSIAHTVISVLRTASQLTGNGRVCVIDTERGRSDQYSDMFPTYDLYEMHRYTPEAYIEALQAAASADYSVTIVDQISHEWAGEGGMLERSAKMQEEANGRLNSFTVWNKATPIHQRFIETLISHPTHLIATMRSKVDWELVDDNGKKKPIKLGMAPVQRDSTEYEFDIFGTISQNHYLELEARGTLSDQFKGRSFGPNEIEEVGQLIGRWLTEGITIFDPAKPSLAKPADIQTVIDLARTLGMTDANLYKSLAHFSANTFNELKEEDLKRIKQQLNKLKVQAATPVAP